MPEERKLVTIIFADFVGSTSLTVSRDPEIVRATMRRTYEELRKIFVGRVVELHRGRIWVESQVGKGSTFTFALPLLVGASDVTHA